MRREEYKGYMWVGVKMLNIEALPRFSWKLKRTGHIVDGWKTRTHYHDMGVLQKMYSYAGADHNPSGPSVWGAWSSYH